jgi:hypothetical protein
VNKGKKHNTYIHGHTVGGNLSPTYNSWSSMMGRCYLPKTRCYEDYGGSGIKVEKRWHEFKNFLEDMGERPEGYVLDRIDNKIGYCMSNCRWLSRLESARNKRNLIYIMHNGKRKCLAELCVDLNLNYKTIYKRIKKYGWPVDRAISTKVRAWIRKQETIFK